MDGDVTDAATSKSISLFLAVLGVDLLSVGSYVALLIVLWRNDATRKRLFPRQLRSLASAGLCVYTLAIPTLIIDFWYLPGTLSGEDYSLACSSGFAIFRTFRLVNVLQETHIALTFLAQSLKWTKLLPVLNRGIPIVWSTGLALGVILQLVNPWTFSTTLEKCVPPRDADGHTEIDYGTVTTLSICFVTALASFLAIVRKTHMPAVVRRQNFQRAMCYPLISVLSFSLLIGSYVKIHLFWDPPWYFPTMVIMECSNGFLNSLAFAVQSRYASLQLREALDSGAEYVSFRVDFGGVDIVDIVCCSANSASDSGMNSEAVFEQPSKH
jgi:hypothetical protein